MSSPLIPILPEVQAYLARAHASFIDGEQCAPRVDARRTLRATLQDGIAARADYARAITAWRLRSAADNDAHAPDTP